MMNKNLPTNWKVYEDLDKDEVPMMNALRCQSKLDIQSQAAYELAIQGPIRPSDGTLPVVYSIKCIYFEPPDFTLEIQSINEYESYLISFIHELGLKLRTLATCTGVRCIRHSHFTLEDALLRKHWSLQYIINNIIQCSEVIQKQNSKWLTPALENAAVT